MKQPEDMTRAEMLSHLDEVAEQWGTPKMTEQQRSSLSDAQLRKRVRQLFQAGEHLGNWQSPAHAFRGGGQRGKR